ncbi:MAG TPA: EVE domain-containing protein [Mizugakiibacter sp.]|nr:EVE domain-containing protein [Mizugakiibacter sp.]
MHYWLMKSEPQAFSITDLARNKIEPWDGVRNYQARNFLRDVMAIGDGILFYHSNCPIPGVVGLAEVVSTSYPDPTQFDPNNSHYDPKSLLEAPRWYLIKVSFVRKLKRIITLSELRNDSKLGNFTLTRRGNRLSVMPVSRAQWLHILGLE